jgi:hypothetical protein
VEESRKGAENSFDEPRKSRMREQNGKTDRGRDKV